MNVLGISAFYHDSAAALVCGGKVVAAAQEERFSRRKHDAALPANAIRYCLEEGAIREAGLDGVVFYDKPVLKFSRLLQTYFSVAPRGLKSFVTAMPLWLKQKLWIPLLIERQLEACGVRMPKDMFFTEHHESHAASAFYPSPFERAAVLTVDGVGEWATSTIGRGAGNSLETMEELSFPHSLGLFYSAFTYFCGFEINGGEYKLMGLAPYGEPRYVKDIHEHLMDLKEDGSFRLNLDYFGYLDSLAMTNERFEALFGGPPRRPGGEITRREMDLARSVQAVTEEVVLRMAGHAHDLTGESALCLSGGVALNSVANGRLLRESPFSEIWIQPAAGDAGGAIGAALAVCHGVYGEPRKADGTRDGMKGALLGPEFSDDEINRFLESGGIASRKLGDEEWASELARRISAGKVVGFFQGRMEFGPRALGNRSILADARSASIQSVLNLKVKLRESFRPFASACLQECASEYFDLSRPSPYMLFVAPVLAERRCSVSDGDAGSVQDRVRQVRSDIPAVTHVDYSSRIQTVSEDSNPRFHALLSAFHMLTGCGVLVNTSFNGRDEPIVCTPEDAYRCFMATRMDCLLMGSYLLEKDG